MTNLPIVDVGAWLRETREHAGVTLRQIADRTKHSVYTLRLLERNRVSELPGGLYRRGIVRSYAKEIGLDPEEALRVFLSHHPQDALNPLEKEGASDAPPQRRGLRTVVGLIGGGIAPVVAGLFYFALNAREEVRPTKVIDGLPPRG